MGIGAKSKQRSSSNAFHADEDSPQGAKRATYGSHLFLIHPYIQFRILHLQSNKSVFSNRFHIDIQSLTGQCLVVDQLLDYLLKNGNP